MASMSGMNVDCECVDIYEKMKTKKNCQTAFFKISDDKKNIVKVDTFEKQTFDELVAVIKSDYKETPLYILHDLHFDVPGLSQQKKLIIINWCDDNFPIKMKMLNSSSFSAVTKVMGEAKPWSVNDLGDFEFKTAIEKAQK